MQDHQLDEQSRLSPSEPFAPGPRSTSTVGRRILRILLWTLVLIPGLFVFLTVVWFVNPRTKNVETVEPADAVVLFAGSSERLVTAVELMERGAAANLVLPNGNGLDYAEDWCDEDTSFQVFCPNTNPITTAGEAQTIGRLAEESGWSRLIAVTSEYHVHRATYLLGQCHDGTIQAVAAPRGLGPAEWVEKVTHEWAGFLGAVILPPPC